MSHQPELPGQPDNRLTIRPKAVVGVVIAVLALVFIFQNAGKGRIEFLFWSVSMPAWIWLLVLMFRLKSKCPRRSSSKGTVTLLRISEVSHTTRS